MKYRNLKKGTIYEVLYTNGELTFCREEGEFYQKFEKIDE